MINQLKCIGTYAKAKLGRFVSDEKGDVNVVSIVVLIGIAVLLALLFKKNIMGLIGTLFKTINQSATNAIK